MCFAIKTSLLFALSYLYKATKIGELVNRRMEQWNTGEPLHWQAAEVPQWKRAEIICSVWKMAEFPF